jgi:hypothetical protein
MIDSTYEIDDIKKELNTFKVYGFDVESDFDTALEYSVGVVMRERMYPIIGDAYYSTLSLVGRDALTTISVNIYWAEVYFAIAEFLLLTDRKAKAAKVSYQENKSMGGVSASGSGYSGKENVAQQYISKAEYLLSLAGYSMQSNIIARSSIHA